MGSGWGGSVQLGNGEGCLMGKSQKKANLRGCSTEGEA